MFECDQYHLINHWDQLTTPIVFTFSFPFGLWNSLQYLYTHSNMHMQTQSKVCIHDYWKKLCKIQLVGQSVERAYNNMKLMIIDIKSCFCYQEVDFTQIKHKHILDSILRNSQFFRLGMITYTSWIFDNSTLQICW